MKFLLPILLLIFCSETTCIFNFVACFNKNYFGHFNKLFNNDLKFFLTTILTNNFEKPLGSLKFLNNRTKNICFL